VQRRGTRFPLHTTVAAARCADLSALLQASQADRICRDIDTFWGRVAQQRAAFQGSAVHKHATGYAAAYLLLDAAASDLAKLRKECSHFAELASVFELSGAVAPITTAIKEAFDDLVAVKDVWDCNAMCEVQFKVRRGGSCCCVCGVTAWQSEKAPAAPFHTLLFVAARRFLVRRRGAKRCGATSTQMRWRRGRKTSQRRSRACPKRCGDVGTWR
jgi:hypothetical protein